MKQAIIAGATSLARVHAPAVGTGDDRLQARQSAAVWEELFRSQLRDSSSSSMFEQGAGLIDLHTSLKVSCAVDNAGFVISGRYFLRRRIIVFFLLPLIVSADATSETTGQFVTELLGSDALSVHVALLLPTPILQHATYCHKRT